MKRKFFYSNWTVIEEHEQTALPGQSLGEPKVTRQFVDIGIDNHLTMDIYNDNGTSIKDTFYFHANSRGDTVAITDNDGNEQMLLEYSTYGVAYEVNEDNDLEELTDFSFIVFGFHGRRVDEETGRMYFRHRYYDQETGRFSQRDPKGYVDSYGLYEAFGGNPYSYRDPMGTDWLEDEAAFNRYFGFDSNKETKKEEPNDLNTPRIRADQLSIGVLDFSMGATEALAEPAHLPYDAFLSFLCISEAMVKILPHQVC